MHINLPVLIKIKSKRFLDTYLFLVHVTHERQPFIFLALSFAIKFLLLFSLENSNICQLLVFLLLEFLVFLQKLECLSTVEGLLFLFVVEFLSEVDPVPEISLIPAYTIGLNHLIDTVVN